MGVGPISRLLILNQVIDDGTCSRSAVQPSGLVCSQSSCGKDTAIGLLILHDDRVSFSEINAKCTAEESLNSIRIIPEGN